MMKIPILYQWIHAKLLETKTTPMRTQRIREVIRRNVRLPPNTYDYRIIKELVEYELIVKVNRKKGYYITNSMLEHQIWP